MPLDKQTIAGVILVGVAIGLIAWMTLDAWEFTDVEPVVESGHKAVRAEIPLEDSTLCEANSNGCFHDDRRDGQST